MKINYENQINSNLQSQLKVAIICQLIKSLQVSKGQAVVYELILCILLIFNKLERLKLNILIQKKKKKKKKKNEHQDAFFKFSY